MVLVGTGLFENIPHPWIAEIDQPGNYLLVTNYTITTTSDPFQCTRFPSHEEAYYAVIRYYSDRTPMMHPHIFQPDWL